MKPPKRSKLAKPKYEEGAAAVNKPSYRDDDPFDQIMQPESASDPDSDFSEYGKKRKMAKKGKARGTKATKIEPPAELPHMSEDDGRQHRGPSLELGELIEIPRKVGRADTNNTATTTATTANIAMMRKQLPGKNTTGLPDILQIHVDHPVRGGPTIINLNLADLLSKSGPINPAVSNPTPVTSASSMSPAASLFDDNDSTLLDERPQYTNKHVHMLRQAQARNSRPRQHKTSFLDIPYEIRLRIYRQVFVTANPIEFTSRDNFQRSSALLRTCKTIHEEGSDVLYGENAFHFERSSARRGAFFEVKWKEIGFKDVRRFLDVIGPTNLSLIKYMSFLLVDAPPSVTPELEEAERRFVNDPVLHYIFRLVGEHARLSKLGLTFAGRKAVTTTEYHFLKALTRIKCHELIHISAWPYHSKAAAHLITKLKELMLVQRHHDEEVDWAKKKKPVVKMWHEKPKSYTV